MKLLKCIESNSYTPKSNVSVRRVKKSKGRRSSSSSIGSKRKRNSYIASSLNRSVYPDEYFPQQQRHNGYSSQELIDQFHTNVGRKRRVKSQPEISRLEYDNSIDDNNVQGKPMQMFNNHNKYHNNGNNFNSQRQNQSYSNHVSDLQFRRNSHVLPVNYQIFDNNVGDVVTNIDSSQPKTSRMRRSISVSGNISYNNTGLCVLPLKQSTPVNQSMFLNKDQNNNNNLYGIHDYYPVNQQEIVPTMLPVGEYILKPSNYTTLPAKTLYQQVLLHPRVQQLDYVTPNNNSPNNNNIYQEPGVNDKRLRRIAAPGKVNR